MASKLRVNNVESLTNGRNITVDSIVTEQQLESAYKIAVIGDSLSTENALAEHAWPSLLQKYINNSGGYCRVVNYSRNSFTFEEASTDPNAFDGRTARDALIQENPDLVIVAFGVVDVIANEDEKSLAQLKMDASNFYGVVRDALPNAKIVHAQQVCHDRVNAVATALTNKDVIPYFMQRKTTGILADSFCEEILDDNIDATIQTNFDNGTEFYNYIDVLTDTDFLIDIDYWKIARIGLMGPDGLHPRTFGKVLQCGYVVNALTDAQVDPFFAKLRKKNYESWYDPDDLIDQIINKNANWDFQYFGLAGADHAVNLNSLYKDVAPTTWYLPYKTALSIPRLVFDAGQPFGLSIYNGPPNQVVVPSVDGGAFDDQDPSLTLAINGCGSVSLVDPVAPGTYVFRYKCGREIYGPYTFTFLASGPVGTTAISDGGTGATTASGARTNLDVYSKVESDTKYTQKSSNLSDLTSAATARNNLSVYSQAESNSAFLNEYSNLSDLPSKATARSNLGVNQSGPTSPSFASGWTNGDSDYKDAAYFKDHNGRVHLEGCVRRFSGSSTVCFTLPFGFRPSKGVGFVAPISGQPQTMLVNSSGTVELAGYGANGELAFIDGVSFMAG